MNWEKLIRDNKHLFEFQDLKYELNIQFTLWKNNSTNHDIEIIYFNGKFLCKSLYFMNDIFTKEEFMEICNS
jgi:hypothetical protein